MRSSRNFFKWRVIIFLIALVLITGCIHPATLREAAPARPETLRIAVLPVANLSGMQAPLKDIRHLLSQGLLAKGFSLVDEEDLEKFMARHRMRDISFIDSEAGRNLKEETGADAVLVTSLVLYTSLYPSKISLWSRLVSTGNEQRILWMDGRGAAGDDTPGLFGLGLIRDPRKLLDSTVQSLVESLSARILQGADELPVSAGGKYDPKSSYRSPVFYRDAKYRVAVVQFYDLSGRKNAEKIMALQFTAAMRAFRNFEVLEPGQVHEKLLGLSMILDHGVSLANADILFNVLDCDLILTGVIFKYEDFLGMQGIPGVEFSVQLWERKSREVVWSSRSSNKGDDAVYFFDFGKVSTAQTLAARMARRVIELIAAK